MTVGTLSACASGDKVDVSSATVIDVRTAAEYAAGHLEGARNIDMQASDFIQQVSGLPKDGSYLLYCRSGARAGQAMTTMTGLGFTDVRNLGGMQAASSATGLAIVT